MAHVNVDVDRDIRYFTEPLEEKIENCMQYQKDTVDKLEEQMTEVDNEIMDLNHKVDGLLKLLKTIGD